jgi:hypothetical protein
MKPVAWMVGASIGSWLIVAMWSGLTSSREVLFGMLAPLAGAVSTWVLVAQTYPARPQLLTTLMMASFAAKMVFFGVYVTIMLVVLDLRPMPFVVSFTTYFIALHLFEALRLQRLFAGNASAPQ